MPGKKKKKNPNLKTLQKKSTRLIRQEYVDYDYLDQLSEEELEWLADFNAEYTNASVKKHSEAEKNRFHKTAELAKDCTDRNNARNRCIYGKKKAHNELLSMDYQSLHDYIDKPSNTTENNVEDALIDYLDQTKESSDTTEDGDEES